MNRVQVVDDGGRSQGGNRRNQSGSDGGTSQGLGAVGVRWNPGHSHNVDPWWSRWLEEPEVEMESR